MMMMMMMMYIMTTTTNNASRKKTHDHLEEEGKINAIAISLPSFALQIELNSLFHATETHS
jgi:hypothetical protein